MYALLNTYDFYELDLRERKITETKRLKKDSIPNYSIE